MRLLLFLNIIFILQVSQTCNAQDWKNVSSSVSIKESSLSQITSTSITLAKTNLSISDLKVLRAVEFGKERTTAKLLCNSLKANLCINGSFFDERGKPLGLLVSSGSLLHKMHQSGSVLTAIFGVSKENPFIIPRENYTNKNALEALQAGPRILTSDQIINSSNNVASRLSGVCINSDKDIIFFAVRSSLTSVSESSLREALLAEKCTDAMYFDGGGSSQMFVKNTVSLGDDYDITGKDLVPVFVVITQKH